MKPSGRYSIGDVKMHLRAIQQAQKLMKEGYKVKTMFTKERGWRTYIIDEKDEKKGGDELYES